MNKKIVIAGLLALFAIAGAGCASKQTTAPATPSQETQTSNAQNSTPEQTTLIHRLSLLKIMGRVKHLHLRQQSLQRPRRTRKIQEIDKHNRLRCTIRILKRTA